GGVPGTLGHLLVLAIGTRLLQQAVDEGGLAVVDVGDNGDVTKVHGSSSGRAEAGARSRRKTGTHFSGSRSKTWNSKRDHGLTPGPKKEARPKGPGTPYALRRNIFRKRQKTMVCLAFG